MEHNTVSLLSYDRFYTFHSQLDMLLSKRFVLAKIMMEVTGLPFKLKKEMVQF